MSEETLEDLLSQIRACLVCEGKIPAPRPVLRAGRAAKILIIGQAPGTKVHASGIPWDDLSGKRLRAWMGVSAETFYDENLTAIIPMGFCYPGKGKSGDLPPRPECAPLWHEKLTAHLPEIRLILLIGSYAQKYYLKNDRKSSLTATVADWQKYAEKDLLPLPHPSPRNLLWFKKNPFFEKETVPALQAKISALLNG